MLQSPIDQIATIGDMVNDVPMLTIVGHEHRHGQRQRRGPGVARHVTSSNEEEGFARAVDAFILGEPPLARTPLGLPPRARACVFGLGGVLTQSAMLHAEAWKRLFDEYLHQRAHDIGRALHFLRCHQRLPPPLPDRRPAEAIRSFLVSRGIELPEPTVRALIERKVDRLVELLKHERSRPTTARCNTSARRARRPADRRRLASRYCHEVLSLGRHRRPVRRLIDGRFASAEHLRCKPRPRYLPGGRARHGRGVRRGGDLRGRAGRRAGRPQRPLRLRGGRRPPGPGDELRRKGADVVVSDLAALLAA